MSLFLCSLAANLKKVFARYYLVVLLATVDTVALTDARSNPLVAIWQRNPKDRIRTRDWTTTIERSIYSYSIMIMTLAFSLSRLHVDIPATSCLYTSLSSRFCSKRHRFRPLAYRKKKRRYSSKCSKKNNDFPIQICRKCRSTSLMAGDWHGVRSTF